MKKLIRAINWDSPGGLLILFILWALVMWAIIVY